MGRVLMVSFWGRRERGPPWKPVPHPLSIPTQWSLRCCWQGHLCVLWGTDGGRPVLCCAGGKAAVFGLRKLGEKQTANSSSSWAPGLTASLSLSNLRGCQGRGELEASLGPGPLGRPPPAATRPGTRRGVGWGSHSCSLAGAMGNAGVQEEVPGGWQGRAANFEFW